MFRFKQFTVRHDLCAMKVGTDGVLLGAWADCSNANTILDVGTGSGLIALMLAQRSEAKIDAIDIDKDACSQALINVSESTFLERIEVKQFDFQTYPTSLKYDLIVSNPPYFVDSLQAPDEKRTIARHNNSLPFELVVQKAVSLLSEKGILSLIVPVEAFPKINFPAIENTLHLIRKTKVKPKPESSPKRLLLEYSLYPFPLQENELTIEISRHIYSEEYKDLTKEFYLDKLTN